LHPADAKVEGLIAHLHGLWSYGRLTPFALSIFMLRGAFKGFQNRAGDFHHTRLTRDRLSATGMAPDLVIPHSPQPAPFGSPGFRRTVAAKGS
jgi:hypothetical protein